MATLVAIGVALIFAAAVCERHARRLIPYAGVLRARIACGTTDGEAVSRRTGPPARGRARFFAPVRGARYLAPW